MKSPVHNYFSISESLIIFVENMGHTNYGGVMKQNFKGTYPVWNVNS